MKAKSKSAAKPEVMTAAEVADYLRVSSRHVTNLAKRGEIPGKQFGTVWRFKRKDIENFSNTEGERYGGK